MTDKKSKDSTFVDIKDLYSLIKDGNGKIAREQAQLSIETCKSMLNMEEGVTPETRGKIRITGILYRGFQDFIDLYETTKSSDWVTKNNLVEKAWVQLCDCKDRIGYVSNLCHNDETLDKVICKIGNIEKEFVDNFGEGMYMSPEIITKKTVCSICKEDARSCEHISGQMYGGVLCSYICQDISDVRAVAIVRNPKDPRCRIWLWQYGGDNTFKNVCLMRPTLRLDDFTDESVEEFEKVVDTKYTVEGEEKKDK